MKMTINGITLEDVTTEEALQLIRGTEKRKNELEVTSSPTRIKRVYNKKMTKVFWTETEIHYILSNLDMTASRLHKNIPRHTVNAISSMLSNLRNKKFSSIGSYAKKMVEDFYNKDRMPFEFDRGDTPVSTNIPVITK